MPAVSMVRTAGCEMRLSAIATGWKTSTTRPGKRPGMASGDGAASGAWTAIFSERSAEDSCAWSHAGERVGTQGGACRGSRCRRTFDDPWVPPPPPPPPPPLFFFCLRLSDRPGLPLECFFQAARHHLFLAVAHHPDADHRRGVLFGHGDNRRFAVAQRADDRGGPERRGCRPAQVTRRCGTWCATSGTNTSAFTPGTDAAPARMVSARLSNSRASRLRRIHFDGSAPPPPACRPSPLC